MRKFRKLLALALVVCIACAVGVTVWAQESTSAVHSNPQSSVDLVELYEHPEDFPNTELIIHNDVSDYKKTVDEMTVKVVDKDGKPVPNIGVYGNPTQSTFLASSTISLAVTDNEGIAILQRVRAGQEPNEAVTVGLADRNQSDSIQQKATISMPDSGSGYEPQTVAWNKTLPIDYLKKQTSAITLTIVNAEGEALPDMWVKLGLPSSTATDGSNPDIGYQEDLPFADRYLITGSDGTCTFSNVGKGRYSIDLWGGSPPFNLVASENPLLQAELVYSDKSTWGTTIDYTEDGEQRFTMEFIPHVPQ